LLVTLYLCLLSVAIYQIKLLNWLDDVDLLESHAWGDKVNYLLASPLLLDLRASLKVGGWNGWTLHMEQFISGRVRSQIQA
jgi:hypothetical protein